MKTTVDGFDEPVVERPSPTRKDWTLGSVGKVVAGAFVLSVVYFFFASWIPAESPADGGFSVLNFAAFWIGGGLFTVLVLAISDLRS